LEVFAIYFGGFSIYLEVLLSTWRILLLYVGWRFLETYYDALALAMLALEDLATCLEDLDYGVLAFD
jgi:hypothetical protein